jgi:hypothetical protein
LVAIKRLYLGLRQLSNSVIDRQSLGLDDAAGHVAELVGIVGGVVSGVINLESSGA